MTSVFIVSSYPMFSQGLESLLHQESRVKVIGRETDIDRAKLQIKELQPDVVICDCSDSASGANLALPDILKDNVKTKVFGVSLQNNDLYLYQAKRWVVKSVEELMEVIEDTPASSPPKSQKKLSQ